MTTPSRPERWTKLSQASRVFGHAGSVEELIELLRVAARDLARSDGATVARREGDEIVTVGTDTVAPFWQGRRFPVERSISGLAILERRPILVPEVRNDPRVPFNAYLATFVSTIAVFPVGNGAPLVAIGVYWTDPMPIDEETVILLTALMRDASAALEGLELRAEVEAARVVQIPVRGVIRQAYDAVYAALR